jgi:predicted DNA-binding transcriptional regulator AlpA
LPPRGLSRVEAAAYVGVSPSLFDQGVAAGTLPKSARIGRRLLWDRRQIDRALDALFNEPPLRDAMAAPEFVL